MVDLEKYPCPKCGEHKLVSDGIVRWRSGPQPPRSMARPRSRIAVSPRADFDETAFYHCDACKTEYVDGVASAYRLSTLYIEETKEKFYFNPKTLIWEDKPWYLSKKPANKTTGKLNAAPKTSTGEEKVNSASGFPPGSVGDVSSRIGYDVRDLLMAGFTHSEIASYSREEIMGVINGEYSLADLRERKSHDS